MKEINIGGGHYSLREPLGSGGMAEVFLAHDEILKRGVALKLLKEQYDDNVGFVERFRREARSAASLNHPHIIVVYDWGRSADGTYCMAMEYAPGGTLKDRILEDGPLPPHKAVEVASQIAQALGFAHERGVIHRDVKPHNVLLSEAGEVKVADFGIARAATATTTSRSNSILGTPSYMSPEQAKGERVGPASDLYSLGIVLYEMLTGELPFEAEDPVALAMKHVDELPRSPREANPDIPEVLEALTLKLLAKDPTDRYGNTTELLEDLRRVQEVLPLAFEDARPVTANRAALSASSVPTTPGAGGTRSRSYALYGASRKLPLALTGAFVALLVLLGAVVWAPWWGTQELAQAQDVARGGLDEPVKGSDKDKRSAGSNEVSEVGGLPEDKGQQAPKANISGPGFANANLPGSDATSQSGVDAKAFEAGLPVEPDSEDNVALGPGSERIRVPEVRGASAEEASQALSDSGHVVAGTAKRHSPEPPGTVIGTHPAVGSSVERGTAVAIVLSSGPTSQEGSNGGKDGARVTTKVETTEATQPSKTRKRNQKSSTAVFVEG